MTTTPPGLEAGATLYGITVAHWGAIEVVTAQVEKVTPQRVYVRRGDDRRPTHLDRIGTADPTSAVASGRYGPFWYLTRAAAFAGFIARNEQLVAEVPAQIEKIRRREAELVAQAERARQMAESGADEDPDLERLMDERLAAVRREREQMEAELGATS